MLVLKKDTLSILIPVYNEQTYLKACVEQVMGVCLPQNLKKEIILVDDASTDNTPQIIEDLLRVYPESIRAFRQSFNQGKGAAIQRAIKEMTGVYSIIQDADLEYDPNDYDLMLEPLVEGLADVVYGSRFAPRKMRRVFNFHHAMGNRFLTFLSNITTGLSVSDMETCYKAFRSELIKSIPLQSKRFGIEPEITAKIAKRDCVVYEVPISYRGRGYQDGKKIGWKDGVSAIYTIFKYFIIDDCFDKDQAHEILKSISKARRFNQWMVGIITPYFGHRLLEVGSGIGNMSRLLPKKEKLILTELESEYRDILEESFGSNEMVQIKKLDLNVSEDFDAIGEESCDTVICMNVLEHIEDDLLALKGIYRLLEPGGKLILLVPQYEKLFGSYDENAGHYRRYERRKLIELLKEAGYELQRSFNFNFLAIPGWWFNSCVLKRKNFSRWQIKLYDLLVPFCRVAEKILPLPGLSIVCIARKPK